MIKEESNGAKNYFGYRHAVVYRRRDCIPAHQKEKKISE
jgi:hypothetical protein